MDGLGCFEGECIPGGVFVRLWEAEETGLDGCF